MRLTSVLMIFLVGTTVGVAASAAAQEGLYSSGELGRRALPGEDAVAEQLERKERALSSREASIAAKEEQLRTAETSLREDIARNEAFRNEIQSLLDELDARQTAEVSRQVKVFEKMRGGQAAGILSAASEEDALLLLRGMRPDRAAKILAAMDPRKAAQLTEKLNDNPADALSGR